MGLDGWKFYVAEGSDLLTLLAGGGVEVVSRRRSNYYFYFLLFYWQQDRVGFLFRYRHVHPADESIT